jgi:Winged helix-turn-helix DNA-binding
MSSTSKTLVAIRLIIKTKLPYVKSNITFDLILSLIDAFENNEEISVQELFLRCGHSTMGIRYHFNELIEDGWIGLYKNFRDQRVKCPYPTQKLLDSVYQVVSEIKKIEIPAEINTHNAPRSQLSKLI